MPTNGVGEWRYSLRFNYTDTPRTTRLYDRFPDGLSTLTLEYYQHGFLTLQHAIDSYILSNRSVEAPMAYGMPFPINAYSHNIFFDFAGNLIGLVVVFRQHARRRL